MKESLEDFIRRNRSEFDTETPDPNVWTAIQRQVPRKASVAVELWIWRAAAAIFLVSTIALWMKPDARFATAEVEPRSEDFPMTEQYYQQQIESKKQVLASFSTEDALGSRTLEYSRLEAMYAVLEDQFSATPTPELRDAMVLNLLVRMDILNQQLQVHEIEAGNETAVNAGSPKEKNSR